MTSRRSALPWIVWIVGMLAYAVAVVNRSSFAALGPAAQEHFEIEATSLSIFLFVQIFVYAACQIPVGLAMARFGPSILVIVGMLAMSVGQLLLAITDELWLAIVARILLGMGDACVFICVIRLGGSWFLPKHVPTVSQITGLVGQLGQLASVVPLALVVDRFGWMAGFTGLAALGVLIAIVAIVTLRDAPGERSTLEKITGRTSPATVTARVPDADSTTLGPLQPVTEVLPVIGPGGIGVWGALRSLMKRPGVQLAFAIHFTTPAALHSFLLLWGTPFLTGGEGRTARESAFILSVAVMVSMVAGIIMGPIASRYARHRVAIVLGVVAATIAAWTVTLLWPGQTPMWWLLILATVMGIGGPASMMSFDVLRTHAHERHLSIGTGLVNSAGFIAAILLVLSIGVLLDLQGAGSPDTYSSTAFRWAMVAQFPVWGIGLAMLFRALPGARAALDRRRRGDS